jgi:hypothetical protein
LHSEDSVINTNTSINLSSISDEASENNFCSTSNVNKSNDGGVNVINLSNSGSDNNISILYFNSRSVKNKIPEIQSRVVNENYDVIAITESWLDDSCFDGEIFPSNYHVFRNDRNSHGGGVLLAIKSDLCPSDTCDFISDDLEIIWADFKTTKGKVLFGVFYRPPSSSKDYMNALDDHLLKIHSSKHDYCFISLVGDFNIHMDWINDEPVNKKGTLPNLFIDTMYTCGFTQVLNEPTYVTYKGNERFLDLVFVSDPSYVKSCETSFNVNNNCDHFAVVFTLDMSVLKTKSIDKPVYCLNRANFDQMRHIIQNSPWNVCMLMDNVNNKWDFIEHNINTAIEQTVPKKSVKRVNLFLGCQKKLESYVQKRKLCISVSRKMVLILMNRNLKNVVNSSKMLFVEVTVIILLVSQKLLVPILRNFGIMLGLVKKNLLSFLLQLIMGS